MTFRELKERFAAAGASPALVWRDERCSYGELLHRMDYWSEQLTARGVARGSVLGLSADFGPDAIALLLALGEHRCTVAPLPLPFNDSCAATLREAGMQGIIQLGETASFQIGATREAPPLLQNLREGGRAGLIYLSSGSSGNTKLILHDFEVVLEKFRAARKPRRMLGFLLFDHFGGLNTCLHVLLSGGCLVTVSERTPEAVCRAIERHGIQVLPTTPTFLGLMLLSGSATRHDLSSLECITYGTEVMAPSLLKRVKASFPNVRLLQTYGLSEVGVLGSQSESDDSTWVRLGGNGFETRVRDGLLEIKSRSAMLGYLNAPSPFTNDGWFMTGDAVEVRDDYFRILGRRSELINVGGEKVYPSEVEGAIRCLDGVLNVAVHGEANAITGQMVVATVSIDSNESPAELRRRLVNYCSSFLPRFKVPQKVIVTREPLHGDRFKTMRKRNHGGSEVWLSS